MTSEQLQIIEEIKAHATIIEELTKKLHTHETKAKKGVSIEEMARFRALIKKKMYQK